MVGWTSRLKKLSNKQRMKTNEQQLEELYANFPESEDKNETLCNLITDSIAAIGFWNTKEPEPEDTTKTYWEDRIWEDVKAGKTLVFGDEDNIGELNLANMNKSLNYLKKHNPDVYEDLQTENWDADTCDVFFQIAVFGEVVFS